ncbi:MAG: hypothetical protein MHM6MM_006722 [Cercozoa sp. M6MM]
MLRTNARVGVWAARRFAAASIEANETIGVVMLNMGGPVDPRETHAFLTELFNDGDIIGSPLFRQVSPFVVNLRAPKVEKQYEAIGGSPIYKWTRKQGDGMVKALERRVPQLRFKHYTAFRYVAPRAADALAEMKKDGVRRVVVFPQYAHFSCTTSGSSLNELFSLPDIQDMECSLIDRWHLHEGFLTAVAQRIIDSYEHERDEDPLVLFSAHSVPMQTVSKGDAYVGEIAASVEGVMQLVNQHLEKQGKPHLRHLLSWQSKVGFMPWMAPSTETVIEQLGAQGEKKVIAVPIAFTSDHIETLYEIDIEYREHAEKHGVQLARTEALNDSPVFAEALADIVVQHLKEQRPCSAKYRLRCPGCHRPSPQEDLNECCRRLPNEAENWPDVSSVEPVKFELQ